MAHTAFCANTTHPVPSAFAPPAGRMSTQRTVRLPMKALPELLAGIPADQQGKEGPDCGAVEPGGYPPQALVDLARIDVVVELFMDQESDSWQFRVG